MILIGRSEEREALLSVSAELSDWAAFTVGVLTRSIFTTSGGELIRPS